MKVTTFLQHHSACYSVFIQEKTDENGCILEWGAGKNGDHSILYVLKRWSLYKMYQIINELLKKQMYGNAHVFDSLAVRFNIQY